MQKKIEKQLKAIPLTYVIFYHFSFFYHPEKSDGKSSRSSKDEKANAKPAENVDEDDTKFDWMLSVGVATVAMFSYALSAGLIHLRRTATS